MLKTTVLALTAAVALTSASASFAADVPRSVTVVATDLNLASNKGVATLDSRIAQAAKLVCGPVDIKSTREVHEYDLCHDAAIANAKPRAEAAIAAYVNGKAVASTAVTVSR